MDERAAPSVGASEDRAPSAGGRRSAKRDLIVSAFLEQEGHVSADDLFDLVRARDPRIGRATVYRTLQWMVDARVARRVDSGEGRARFEHSFRHPRHFHLVCRACGRSFEFLSPDIESVIDAIAAERGFTPRQSVLQVEGTCVECRAGRISEPGDRTAARVLTRDALRIAIATTETSSEFHARAARLLRDSHSRGVFLQLAEDERTHHRGLHERYRALVGQDPHLESRPTSLFLKGAAGSLFAGGAQELGESGGAQKVLMIAIRCERGSHRFFRRCGERLGDSEARQVFLEFASLERGHLDRLTRAYRDLVGRSASRRSRRAAEAGRGQRSKVAVP